MIAFRKPSAEQILAFKERNRAIIEAALDPDFGHPGMTLRQKIKAAEKIFDQLDEENQREEKT